MNQIPESHLRLLNEPIVANLATVMPDGQPQVNPVWANYDGDFIYVNSSSGRQKDKNIKDNSMATLLFVDPQNAYFWLEIRGTVVEISTENALEHINALTQKYMNKPTYPFLQEGEVRVTYKIEPKRVISFGE